MSRNALFPSRLFVVLLACLSLAACEPVDPNSPLGKRKTIFKKMLKTSEQLGGMLRGRVKFDEPAFAAGASSLSTLSQQPWQHFPQVKDEGKSSAKDEVWQNQLRFNELAKQLESATANLALVSSQKPLIPSNVAKPFKQVENACEACHNEFRDY